MCEKHFQLNFYRLIYHGHTKLYHIKSTKKIQSRQKYKLKKKMVRFNKKKHYNFILLASLTNRTYILHDTKGRIQDTYFCNSIFKNVYKYHNILGFRVMVFNATFNSISVISILLVP